MTTNVSFKLSFFCAGILIVNFSAVSFCRAQQDVGVAPVTAQQISIQLTARLAQKQDLGLAELKGTDLTNVYVIEAACRNACDPHQEYPLISYYIDGLEQTDRTWKTLPIKFIEDFRGLAEGSHVLSFKVEKDPKTGEPLTSASTTITVNHK